MPHPSTESQQTQLKTWQQPSLPSIAQRLAAKFDCPVSTVEEISRGRQSSARAMTEADFETLCKLKVLDLATTYCAAQVQEGKTTKEVFETCARLMATQFPAIGVNELDEAFALAASKKIQADLTAYGGKFSAAMFGAVLAAYEEFRRPVLFELDKRMELEDGGIEPSYLKGYTVAGHLAELRNQNHEFEKWQDVPVWFANRIKELGVFEEIEKDYRVSVWVDCKRVLVQDIEGRLANAFAKLDRAEHKRLNLIKDQIENDPEIFPVDLNPELFEMYAQRLAFALFADYVPAP
jgi:hypothetical protein